MAKKNKNNRSGVVFSTNDDFEYDYDSVYEEETLAANQQRLRVFIDRKKRRGKEVSLVTGFVGTEEDMKALAKLLKTKCGVGGSAKEGEILIQGNHRDKIVDILLKEGYTQTKKSGG